MGGLSSNAEITAAFVLRHIKKPWALGYEGLPLNDFGYARKKKKYEENRRICAAWVIQEWWYRVSNKGKRDLERIYAEMHG